MTYQCVSSVLVTTWDEKGKELKYVAEVWMNVTERKPDSGLQKRSALYRTEAA